MKVCYLCSLEIQSHHRVVRHRETGRVWHFTPQMNCWKVWREIECYENLDYLMASEEYEEIQA